MWCVSLISGNSNSLAHLVDNEIPLSQMDVPTAAHQHTQSRRFRHHKQKNQQSVDSSGDELDDIELGNANGLSLGSTETLDDEEVVVVGNTEIVAAVAAIAATNKARERHNLSDSYNNLFNGDYDASLSNATTPATSPLSEMPLTGGSGSNLLAAAMMGTSTSRLADNLPKSVSQSENMYSNIPNNAVETAGTCTGQQQQDVNLHVYSNLIDERNHHLPATNASRTSNGTLPPARSAQQMHNPLDLPSTLLCDDLDLDDPMSASFVTKSHNAGDKQRKFFTSNPNIPDVLPKKQKSLVSSSSATDNVKLQMSSKELSSSRLRILHDTTMIESALDLDSLDDASLANTSQACLVKTRKSSPSPPPLGFKV